MKRVPIDDDEDEPAGIRAKRERMSLHDKRRKISANGKPCLDYRYRNPDHHVYLTPIAPTLYLSFEKLGIVRLFTFLLVSGNSSRDFGFKANIQDISGYVQDYQDDPEGTLKEWFDYEGPQ